MFSQNNKISVRQLQILFIMYILGTGVIILPRTISEFAGQDGWILIILSILAALIGFFIISSLGALFPNFTFVEYASKIVTKPVGYVIALAFALRIILKAAIELRLFGEITKQILLKNTPISAIFILMLIACTYLISKGFEVIGRISEILIFIVLIPLILVFSFAIIGTDFTNLLPIAKTPIHDLAIGTFFTAFAFSGIEFILLIYPFVTKQKEIKKGIAVSIIFTGILLLFISIITLARFGPADTKRQLWPILQIMDTIDLPGAVNERLDALVMTFWIISVFISTSVSLLASSHILNKLFKTAYNNYYVIPIAILVFIIAQIPENIMQTYDWLSNCDIYLGCLFIFIVPLLLLLIAKLRKLGDKK